MHSLFLDLYSQSHSMISIRAFSSTRNPERRPNDATRRMRTVLIGVSIEHSRDRSWSFVIKGEGVVGMRFGDAGGEGVHDSLPPSTPMTWCHTRVGGVQVLTTPLLWSLPKYTGESKVYTLTISIHLSPGVK